MERVELTKLFDAYEKLLTNREREIFKYYYYEDYSLSEIAENLNVSRTAIHNIIKKCENKLQHYEQNLNIIKNTEILTSLLEETDIERIKDQIKIILN